jgi:hypothetical protein
MSPKKVLTAPGQRERAAQTVFDVTDNGTQGRATPDDDDAVFHAGSLCIYILFYLSPKFGDK